jgi:hypothetical protein
MGYERGRKDGVPSNAGPKATFTGRVMQDALPAAGYPATVTSVP